MPYSLSRLSCLLHSLTLKWCTDVRWTFGATCGVSRAAIYCPTWSPSIIWSRITPESALCHSRPTQTFSWSGRTLTVVGTGLGVLRWKDPVLLIFMNKVWTHWSAAALCIIIIITLVLKPIAVLSATLDIYMKVVSKQVMKSRRLMTVR